MRGGADFERAVLAVVDGDLDSLRALLAAHPALARARSTAPHQATLLHYVAANGVEDELQRTPENAVDVCRTLLDAGAEPDAVAASYGGGEDQTPLCLLVSSWHPFTRGVQADLVRALVGGGAQVDGRGGDGAPLATALVFGYTRAAEALVECGARTGNVLFAAGLGDLDAVRAWFTAEGVLRPGARGAFRSPVGAPAPTDPAETVQEAFHLAVTHGRRAVAEDLLARGARVDGTVRGHHCALPLPQAVFVHELEVAGFLLERGADPRARDGKRGTSALEMARSAGLDELARRMEGPDADHPTAG